MRIRVVVPLLTAACFLHLSLAQVIQTPLEASGYARLSSHSAMLEYLAQLDASSTSLHLSNIGESVQGREMTALFFSLEQPFRSRPTTKPLVLIYCQQHGNEPSGKEAALVVARTLAMDDPSLLKDLDLILVPQVNPDGAEAGQRRNGNDMDLNRNHVIQSEPEVRALHLLFQQWKPEITLDVHEYNAVTKSWVSAGFIKDAEEMLDGVTNLNVTASIRDFSMTTFIPETGKRIVGDGFRFSRYIVGSPFENQRIRHSTTAINDGRQSMGIRSTFSFIIEGKRYGDLLTEIKRRTEGQVSAVMSFLKTVAEHGRRMKQIVDTARVVEPDFRPGKMSHIQMDYFPDPTQQTLPFPVFDLHSWHHVTKPLEPYEPTVKVKKSVQVPFAYFFPPDEKRLISFLAKNEIQMYVLESDAGGEVETYGILHVTPGYDEDKPWQSVDVKVERRHRTVLSGTVVVPLTQAFAKLIPLLLEPQSTWSLCGENSGRKHRLEEYLREGTEYPVRRLIDASELKLKALK